MNLTRKAVSVLTAACMSSLILAGCAATPNTPSALQGTAPPSTREVVEVATQESPTQTPYVIVVTATPAASTGNPAGTAAMVAAETVATVATTVPAIKATVSQAGNVQSLPTLEGGIVRDQIAAGETVTLRERSADGQWFAVVDARAKEGWVHVDLLQLENVDVDTVPVSAEAELIAQTPAPASTVTNASTTAAVPNAPTLLAAPEHVGLGTTITVKGEGWPPQAQVALLAGLDGFDPTHELATVEPGTDGRWSTQVQFGTGEDGKPLPPGHYRIVAQTFTGDAFAIAEVELVP